jgi:hypothetical protein
LDGTKQKRAPNLLDNERGGGFDGSAKRRPIQFLAFLSHHKEDGGDAARIFVDTARRITRANRIVNSEPDSKLQKVHEMSNVLGNNMIFLDSTVSDLARDAAKLTLCSPRPFGIETLTWQCALVRRT